MRGCRFVGRVLLVGMVAAAAVVASAAAQEAPVTAPPEIRAVWVDAFHEGIRSPAEAQALVAAASRAGLNTLFVQVRRRGDALYASPHEPPLDDPAFDPAFDALAHIVELAHRAGLKVHAWINAMPLWRDEAPPRDARHVFNRHGASAQGDALWLTAAPDGSMKFPVGYFLDPGHPAAAAHLATVYLDIATRYGVDGIHFDYIRYPETEGPTPVQGAAVGYNAVNLARFQRAHRRSDVPPPGDAQWIAWRRAQVTALVRRVYLEAKAVKPALVVSAALIPWGQPPAADDRFHESAPMQRVFQDWQGWLRDGLLDLAVPMNYARETDDRVRTWFDGWMAFEKRNASGRHLAIGLGAYRNTPAHTIAQVGRARAPEGGHRAQGVSFFSYAVPVTAPPRPDAPAEPPSLAVTPASTPDRLAFLVDGAEGAPGPFAAPARIPPMPWIEQPTEGMLAGLLAGPPAAVDGRTVAFKRTGGFPWFRRAKVMTADGNGFFGVARLRPGTYRVWVAGASGTRVEVRVEAGRVARVDLPPVR